MRTFKLNNKGFTLIELLVVISIIGLLSSVVMGSLSSARQKANNTKVVQSVSQIKTALELYRNDKGKYPNENVQDYPMDQDAINFLNTELVTNKYIPSILNPATQDNGYGFQMYYLTGDEWIYSSDGLWNIACGGRKLKSYVFVFYNSQALNLQRVGYYWDDYYYDYEPWWTGEDNTYYYCIGQ
jgi:prepilin-type N-terminal cleavage/methylation domain-containing protein